LVGSLAPNGPVVARTWLPSPIGWHSRRPWQTAGFRGFSAPRDWQRPPAPGGL